MTAVDAPGALLLPQHHELLAARAISDGVAVARGYRSIGRTEARALGFTGTQARPGLLLPLWRVDGEPGGYQLRPDDPRLRKDGKPIKYETPKGQRNVLDVPPTIRDSLHKGSQAILITEGAFKTDALASLGIPCINLAGVYGWRGKNKDDGYTALADWEMVNIKGSIFVLAFDSDIVTKPGVHQALARLKRFLEGRGAAKVRVLVLPTLLSGKTGIDDYIAATNATVEDLAKLIVDTLPAPPSTRELPDPPDRGRPVISTNGRHMRDITAASMAALTAANKDKPWLFARGTTIAQLSIGGHGAEADILSQDALRGVLDRIADFVSIDGGGNEKPQRPPIDVVRDILALKSYPLPPLNLLAEAPLFLLDGTLLARPGYHRESGIYLHMDGLATTIRTDLPLAEAVRWLMVELLGQFPFTDDGSSSHAVALTLQPFVRMLISGPTPLYLVNAPTRGTGKGLLVETTGIIPTGRTPEVMAMPYGEEELEKRITSILLAGAQHILLDNVRSLKSSPLEAVLTTTLWRGRRLGHSEMVSAPNLATWVATGNNVSISAEMVRRLVPIRLDAQVERPEERTGWRHPHLVAWTKEHRSLLVSACISIVQAWLDAGMPKGTETMGRFESWAETMGGILSVSGIKGFLSNREGLYTTADSETEEWRAACTAWWDAFEDRAITASDLLEVLKAKSLLLDVWGGRSALAGQQRIGRTLAEQRDRVFGRYIVKGAGRDGHTRSAAYQLVRASGSLQNHRNPVNPAPNQQAVDIQTVDSVVSWVSEPPQTPDDSVEV